MTEEGKAHSESRQQQRLILAATPAVCAAPGPPAALRLDLLPHSFNRCTSCSLLGSLGILQLTATEPRKTRECQHLRVTKEGKPNQRSGCEQLSRFG